jgi:formylglycine-generating enzyme
MRRSQLASIRAACALAVVLLVLSAAESETPERKVALVIGNGNYEKLSKLPTTVNDATDMAEALTSLGYQVTLIVDADKARMKGAIADFETQLKGSLSAFFYYGGHAFHMLSANWLVPVDGDPKSDFALKNGSIQLNPLLSDMNNFSKVGIAVLDACRNPKPAGTRWIHGRGGLLEEFLSNNIIVCPAAFGSLAEDGPGRNSAFTDAVLRHIRSPGMEAVDVFSEVQKDVIGATNGKEKPIVFTWFHGTFELGGLTADRRSLAQRQEQAAKAAVPPVEEKFGKIVVHSDFWGCVLVDGMYAGNLLSYNVDPGTHAVEMRYGFGLSEMKTVTVEKGQTVTVQFSRTASPRPRNTMVLVKGEIQTVTGQGKDGKSLTIQYSAGNFLIGRFEVTQAEWSEVMEKNPSVYFDDNNAVTNVDWYQAVEYCNARSRKEGLDPCYTVKWPMVRCDFFTDGYRLPTEEEWERAARGGNASRGYTYAGGNDPDAVAWYKDNARDRPAVVGTRKPNELGIYDMSGNVWEWCEDSFVQKDGNPEPEGNSAYDPLHVARGGSWKSGRDDPDDGIAWKSRIEYLPLHSADNIGFRVVRTVLMK